MKKKQLTTKEQAQLLVNRFYEVQTNGNNMEYDSAVECALIAVDEVLKLHKKLPLETLEYYAEVKHEIENDEPTRTNTR